jgi:hypothetical protein
MEHSSRPRVLAIALHQDATVRLAVVALSAAILLFLGMSFIMPAHAQEAETSEVGEVDSAETSAVDADVEEVLGDVLDTEGVEEASEDVDEDTLVSADDMEVGDPRILPNSRLYGLKNFWRRTRVMTTRSPVKKAELQLRYAGERFIEAQKLSQSVDGAELDDVAEVVTRTIERARSDMRAISERTEQLRDAKQDRAADVERFLDRVADRSMKQSKMLDRLEERAPDAVRVRIAEAREQMAGHVADVVEQVDDAELVADRFSRALDNQRGGTFKDFKNVEILKRIEAKAPEAVKVHFRAAQERAVERLKDRVQDGGEGEFERFDRYVRDLSGDTVRHFEVLDDVRSKADLPADFVRKIDALKSKAIERFNGEFEAQGTEGRDHLLNAFRDDDAGAIRTREQFRNFVPKEVREEIEKSEDVQFEKFRARFQDDPNALETADLAQELAKRARENPDAVDFAAMERLKERLSPEQQEFVRQLEDDGAERFREQFDDDRDDFLERFNDPNAPQAGAVLEHLRDTLPPEARAGIQRAIDRGREQFDEHVRDLEDPRILGHIKEAIDNDDDLRDRFEAGDPAFFERLEAKRDDLVQRSEERRHALEERLRPLFENTDTEIPDDLPEELRRRIEEKRETLTERSNDRRDEFERRSRDERPFDAQGELFNEGERRDIEQRRDLIREERNPEVNNHEPEPFLVDLERESPDGLREELQRRIRDRRDDNSEHEQGDRFDPRFDRETRDRSPARDDQNRRFDQGDDHSESVVPEHESKDFLDAIEDSRERAEERRENIQERANERREQLIEHQDDRRETIGERFEEKREEAQGRVEDRRDGAPEHAVPSQDNLRERVEDRRGNIQERFEEERAEFRDRTEDRREAIRDRADEQRDILRTRVETQRTPTQQPPLADHFQDRPTAGDGASGSTFSPPENRPQIFPPPGGNQGGSGGGDQGQGDHPGPGQPLGLLQPIMLIASLLP